MWSKLKTVIVTVLSTLGVLFIILMIIPDDEDEAVDPPALLMQDVREDQKTQEVLPTQEPREVQDNGDSSRSTVTLDIPASEISDKKLKFTTKTLDGRKVDQDIFADYDITLVHVWGTFCGPCIEEMGEYARFYENAPENVNLVGIICDVYDGIDTNVNDADDILNEAGAGFMNLRTSDSIYDVTEAIDYIPTSFFVDRNGHIIGEIMIGRSFDDTMSRLNGYIR